MSQNVEEERVKKRLHQALKSLFIGTCRKYVTLFLIPIFFFFFVNHTQAKSAPPVPTQDGKTIVVQATVLLTPEFIYSIKKNSSLIVKKSAFVLGEEMSVTMRIAGGNNEPLRGHSVRLYVVQTRGDELMSVSGETNGDGLAHFVWPVDANFLGNNILRAVDLTYDTPIPLQQTISFLVYAPTNDEKQRKQAIDDDRLGNQLSSLGQNVSVVVEIEKAVRAQNSGTIVTRDSAVMHSRAGP